MFSELERLLAQSGFLPHGYCINWSPALLGAYVVSDLLIFLSYASMPLAIGYFARRRRDFPYRWLLWMFAAFIMACGTTHLMGAIVLWRPMYVVDAGLRAVTAAISIATAFALWPLLPHALRLPSPEQLRRTNESLEKEVAERKRVEAALRIARQATEDTLIEERRLQAAIVESSDDAIFAETLEGVVTSWNRAAERMFGFAASEMIGRHFSRIIPEERHGEEAGYLAAVARGDSIRHSETERSHKDGRRLFVSVTISPIRDKDGRIIGASKIVRDITDQKNAEAALKESEQRFRRLFHETPVPLCHVNADGDFMDRNERFLKTFGYTAGEVASWSDWWRLACPDPECRTQLRSTWNAAVAGALDKGGDIEPVEWRVRCKDGKQRICLVSGILLGEDMLATLFDVSDLVAARQEIERLNTGLERHVAERTAELVAANAELDSFAYAVSHDLRAPLRGMNGFANALEEDYGERLDEQARVYLREIREGSRRMGELIDGILTLSRSTRGGLQLEPVDLSELAQSVMKEIVRMEPERRVDFQVQAGLVAHGDRRMLEAVLRNLLGNAWKYSGRNPSATIWFTGGHDGGRCRCCISDNGAGFDMRHADKLFKPFQRLHRQDEFPGIGVGLATVQRIIHRHGGSIDATSSPGSGATFCFTLPALPAGMSLQP